MSNPVFTASAHNARISPRKARLSATLIRGRRVEEALTILSFEQRRGSSMIKKIIESAVANAADLGGVDPMELVVVDARVDNGFVIKRFRPASRGRAAARNKRCSHISIGVAKGEPKPVKAAKPAKTAKPAPQA
jgi:large subunit ribosomal protein L22